MTRVKLMLIASLTLASLPIQTAYSGDGINALITAQHLQAEAAAEEAVTPPAKKTLRKAKPGGGVTGAIKQTNGVAELSAQDCKNVGGKVITVSDDRCGKSGQYCRMPDTNAVCIDILN